MNRIDPAVWRQQVWRNRLQSLILLAVMALFLVLLGHLLWGGDGVVMLLVLGVFAVLFNPTISPWLVMRMYGATPLDPRQVPALWQVVARLAERADLPRPPRLFYVPSLALNAFAVGSRESPAIGVTDGLLRQLDLRELAGVLAHEISHVRSNDLWVMGLADLFSRATSVLSLLGQLLLFINLPLILFADVHVNWFAVLLLVFAPTLSALAQLALSRTREFDADLNAARLTGDPDGLARALVKIEQVQGGWLERVFLPGRRVPEPSLLRTHPRTEERVARLMELKPQWPDDEALFDVIDSAWMWPETQRVSRSPRWHINGLWY